MNTDSITEKLVCYDGRVPRSRVVVLWIHQFEFYLNVITPGTLFHIYFMYNGKSFIVWLKLYGVEVDRCFIYKILLLRFLFSIFTFLNSLQFIIIEWMCGLVTQPIENKYQSRKT